MNVQQLIDHLQKLPPKAEVFSLYDGHCLLIIECVFMSKKGVVIIMNGDAIVYHDDHRPIGAPTEKEVPYWETPSMEEPK